MQLGRRAEEAPATRHLNGIFLVGRKHRETKRNGDTIVGFAYAVYRTRHAHRLIVIACCEIDQHVHEMTGTQMTFARNERATCRKISECVLPNVVASLKEDCTAVHIHPVV